MHAWHAASRLVAVNQDGPRHRRRLPWPDGERDLDARAPCGRRWEGVARQDSHQRGRIQPAAGTAAEDRLVRRQESTPYPSVRPSPEGLHSRYCPRLDGRGKRRRGNLDAVVGGELQSPASQKTSRAIHRAVQGAYIHVYNPIVNSNSVCRRSRSRRHLHTAAAHLPRRSRGAGSRRRIGLGKGEGSASGIGGGGVCEYHRV